MKNGHSQKDCKCPFLNLIVVGRDGIEPPTRGFSVFDDSFNALLATRLDCSLNVLIHYRYVRFAGQFRQNQFAIFLQ